MKPKLYILPAHRAPEIIEPGSDRKARKTRIFDGNGTEFVGISDCSAGPDHEHPLHTIVTVTMRLQPGEHAMLEEPPESLHDRLRAIMDKWHSVERFDAGDDAGVAAKNVRMDCADELEALLNGDWTTP